MAAHAMETAERDEEGVRFSPQLPAGRGPYVSVFEAVRRHPVLAFGPLVLLVGLAVGYGLLRSPTYTASAQLSVGRIDVNAPGALAGFTQATATLTAGYSRAVSGDGVIEPVAQQLGITPRQVRNRVLATPIPDSQVMSVIATAATSGGAVRLANATSGSLINYITQTNRSNPDAPRLLRQVRRASVAYQARLDRQRRLERASASPTSGITRADVRQATAAAEVAQLRLQTAESNFRGTTSGDAITSLLLPLTNARFATSDRVSKLEIYVIIAVIAGLILGFGLATLRASEEARRAYRSFEPS